ncbi:DUF4038 domain-containing protein [Tolypothrix bouteillei VB521301]|uniref:DUF4038 domain-containing protein n=1 Tax=Tolypothrix bouteillei VB521301 TaxID=1479485 RepID=A0A0C1NKP5_9CYAN|nr:DUF4038 domain-containing protein [Tolypothrix bouteillei VB521301]
MGKDRRFLYQKEGTKPFFYLGDTAWELFHRLNREEADLYLRDRASKGFTVIQAVVLAEVDGLNTPNPYGDKPLKNNDPTQPNEAYFQHVDYIVNRAAELGLYIGMLPTWGDKWNKAWGVGPEIFNPTNAEAYGRYLGNRYKDKPIIWILGGDRNPDREEHLAIIRAMAKGLQTGHKGKHLMTFHPQGGSSSSIWFQKDEWLAFNMFQSGHTQPNLPNYEATLQDYALNPPKPVLDGEPRYEDHPIGWNPEKGWFDNADVRQAAYWSMLSGALGHTYGNHNIWQMWQEGREPISSARTPWRKALKHPGSTEMGYMRRLFESRPFNQLVPDSAMIVGPAGDGADRIAAARAANGLFAFIYTPTGQSINADLRKITGSEVQAYWFNPRTGRSRVIGKFSNKSTQRFQPSTSGRGNDWVLVLDSVN